MIMMHDLGAHLALDPAIDRVEESGLLVSLDRANAIYGACHQAVLGLMG
jgi:hypothetical protein